MFQSTLQWGNCMRLYKRELSNQLKQTVLHMKNIDHYLATNNKYCIQKYFKELDYRLSHFDMMKYSKTTRTSVTNKT